MAGSVNKVLLIGRLGADPEIKQMINGKSVARLSLATSQSWKDKNTGEKKEKTEWHRIVVFNEGLVNVVQQYLKKGAQVYIEGQLSTRKWKDEKSGQDKYSTEVVIQGYNSSLTMLGGEVVLVLQTIVLPNKLVKIMMMVHKYHKTIWTTKFHFSFYAKN